MAESIGLEPMHPNRDDRLAICCITTLPTLQQRGTGLYVYYLLAKVNLFLHILFKVLFQNHCQVRHKDKTDKNRRR